MRRPLRSVLARVNQLAERAKAAKPGDVMAAVTARLLEARRRCARGEAAPQRSEEEIRRSVPARLVARIIAGQRRVAADRQQRAKSAEAEG